MEMTTITRPPNQPNNSTLNDLNVLVKYSRFIYSRDHEQTGCCSCTSYYKIFDDQNQVILKGHRKAEEVSCCGGNYKDYYEPLVFTDPQSNKTVMEVVVPKYFLRCKKKSASVNVPPGTLTGKILRASTGFQHFILRDAKSGRTFICKEKRFLHGHTYPIQDAVTVSEVANIKYSGDKYTLQVTDGAITPSQKALFLAMLTIQDMMGEEQRGEYSQLSV